MNRIIIIISILIVGILLAKPFYTVDETQQVIITQFGKPVGDAITEPGLHFKLPFIHAATYFPKILLEWDGDPGQIPTNDKTFIWVDTFARWRIKDPLKFFKSANNEKVAQKKLDDILDAATYNFITSYHLIEAVRSTNRLLKVVKTNNQELPQEKALQEKIKLGRNKMTRSILEQAAPKLEGFGIEIIDFRFKRINYVQEVRNKIYERMIAERKQISEKYRSEGKGESKKIQGEQQKELRKIQSVAYKTSEEIKGKADAEATKIYARAYNNDPEFYSFINTLDIYKNVLNEDIKLILSNDSTFFKYLQDYKK